MNFWRLKHSHAPIFVGPWRSELGFEVLYWLPWLAHWRHRDQIDRERLIVLSRGGAGYWYDVDQSVELFDYLPVKDLRMATAHDLHERQSVKQYRMSAWESHFYALTAERLGVRRYQVLHPSAMYQQCETWWTDQCSFRELLMHLRFQTFETPPVPIDVALPERYIAVRFYARATLPMREDVLDWARLLVQQLASQIPVVVLGSSRYLDDHVDFPIQGPNITNIGETFPVRDNLALQSAILKRATAFVGTYGGTMQLAVRLGVPSVGFYLEFAHTAYAHKMLTEWLGVKMKVPVFIGRPHDAEMIRQVIHHIEDLPKSTISSSSA